MRNLCRSAFLMATLIVSPASVEAQNINTYVDETLSYLKNFYKTPIGQQVLIDSAQGNRDTRDYALVGTFLKNGNFDTWDNNFQFEIARCQTGNTANVLAIRSRLTSRSTLALTQAYQKIMNEIHTNLNRSGPNKSLRTCRGFYNYILGH